MVKNIYEILDEFDSCTTKEQRRDVLIKYASHPVFTKVLAYTFNPKFDFYVKAFPKQYKQPDTFPGIRYAGIESELRRVYLFLKGDSTADSLSEEKRNILLLQLLESFEPREAQIFVNMMKKDLGIKYLTPNLVKEVFPALLV